MTWFNIMDCVFTLDYVGGSQFKEVSVQIWVGHERWFQCENNWNLQPLDYVLSRGFLPDD